MRLLVKVNNYFKKNDSFGSRCGGILQIVLAYSHSEISLIRNESCCGTSERGYI